MGLFSRNKGQRQQSPPPARPPAPAPIPQYEPFPAVPPPWGPAVHPPSGLAATSPQPEPSPSQYQQQLFHQTYQVLQPPPYGTGPHVGRQQAAGAAGAAAGAATATATGTATIANEGAGGGATSGALLRQAVQAAAREGKPLTLNFVAQMQPVMANNPYGVAMPHQHPYGPPHGSGSPSPQPEGWRPGHGQNPYDSIRIPALPDMRDMPAELQDFRDHCATGVRQAVAMITAMEHQLWWERSRRQQAEEDCKVLLAAVRMERGVGEALMGAEERRREEAAQAAAKLTLAADELPQASEAATTIQKHVRGHLARKEFESHLRDILRGVDPSLDPAALPTAAQSHVSHVNATGAPRRLGLRTLLGEVVEGTSAGGGSEQVEAARYYRRQVERIGQRLAAHKDSGEPHPGAASGDPLMADVKQLLSGSYPASSAQVIAALVRRCRELQAALLEAVGELEQAQLSIQGLKDANARVSELSGVRADLESSRQDNLRLVATVAKLRTALTAQAAGANAGAARENPYVAAWYRKAYADSEWQRVPPGGPGGVALMDGPDSAVETWDDLRAAIPEPVMVPRVAVPGTQYKDLLGLKQDMIMAASQGPPDPLYTMHVPDRSAFLYERDTPLVPMQSAAPLIRESLPPASFVGVHQDLHRQSPRPSAPGATTGPHQQHQQHPHPHHRQDSPRGNMLPSSAINRATLGQSQQHPQHPQQHPHPQGATAAAGGAYQHLVEQQERLRQQAEWEAAAAAAGSGGGGGGGSFRYTRDTPVVPVYSVLPLIREDEYVRRSMSPPRADARETLRLPSTPPLQPQPPSAAASVGQLSRQPSTTMATNMPYIRDRVQASPSQYPSSMHQHQHQMPVPPEVVAAAAVAATMPPLAQQQQQLAAGLMPPPSPSPVSGGGAYGMGGTLSSHPS